MIFTLDAVFALYVLLIVASTVAVVFASTTQSADSTLELSRLARDVFEVKTYSPGYTPPAWLKTDAACNNAANVGVESAVVYVDNGAVQLSTLKVCT